MASRIDNRRWGGRPQPDPGSGLPQNPEEPGGLESRTGASGAVQGDRPAHISEEILLHTAAAQSYAELRDLVVGYCESVEAEVRLLAPGDPRGPEAARRVLAVLRNACTQLRESREALAAQVAELARVKRLLEQPGGAPGMLRLEA